MEYLSSGWQQLAARESVQLPAGCDGMPSHCVSIRLFFVSARPFNCLFLSLSLSPSVTSLPCHLFSVACVLSFPCTFISTFLLLQDLVVQNLAFRCRGFLKQLSLRGCRSVDDTAIMWVMFLFLVVLVPRCFFFRTTFDKGVYLSAQFSLVWLRKTADHSPL